MKLITLLIIAIIGLSAVNLNKITLDSEKNNFIFLEKNDLLAHNQMQNISTKFIEIKNEEKFFLVNPINVCYAKNFKPYIYEENGMAKGISIDFMNAMARNSNLVLKYIKANSFKEQFKMLQEGECDLVPLIAKEPNTYDFLTPSTSYSLEFLSVMTHINEPYIANMKYLDNKKIAVNEAHKNNFEKVKMNFPGIDLIPLRHTLAIKKLKEGEIFGYVNGHLFLSYEVKDKYHGEFKIMRTLDHLDIGITNRKPELVELINNGIKNITTKEKSNINSSWKNISYEKPLDYGLIYKILALLFVGLLFFVYKQSLLRRMNIKLVKEVKKQVKANHEKEIILFQQAKLASMGDMLRNIAHQWRQPLNEINSIVMALESVMLRDKIDQNLINKKLDEIEKQTFYMSKTIGDFSDYFSPSKKKEEFYISEVI